VILTSRPRKSEIAKGQFAWRLALYLVMLLPSIAWGETGYEGWLRYAPIEDNAIRHQYETLPSIVHRVNGSAVAQSAEQELIRGVQGMLGKTLKSDTDRATEPNIYLGTIDELLLAEVYPDVPPDGFRIFNGTINGRKHLLIAGSNDRGILYGVFHLLRLIALQQPIQNIHVQEDPYAPIRVLNHWDNLDGTIERGYAGRSIFWEDEHIVEDLSRVRDYARLMASVGINGCSINNVNADFRVIDAEHLQEVARVAEVFRDWGIQTYISLNFASPREIGSIETFDPLDPAAVKFWTDKINEIYSVIPDLGGFVLKADSEGRLGPSEYGRTHADAANVIARAAKPHGGKLFYRGFVYNHKMDWRDLSLDRAVAAYNNFHKLDGQFEDNVIIQIKHGPIDFQVREPASPLFAGLAKTNQAIELQITQEYLGQQKHLCYVVPMGQEVLNTDMRVDGKESPVKELVSGKTHSRPIGGFVGVSNVGRDTNWLGHHLAMANLYGFGRLAWIPDLPAREIVEEWTRLTFGNDPKVVETVVGMQMDSWPIYESYTGPLGIGTLTDIIHIHFGPAPESSEHNGWGQWHRANKTGVGMNRTQKDGTGFIGQYPPELAAQYESLETCPDDLLLFLHHVPYTHVLKNGKTVIQHFYDEHYSGAEGAKKLAEQWESLRGHIDDQRFEEVLARQLYQADHADVWRDSICNWFHKLSEINDEHGRVGNHPDRIEAESLTLSGYEVTDITPWEAASGAKAVQLPDSLSSGSISWGFNGEDGAYDLAVQFFDEGDGVSEFQLGVAGKNVASWNAPDHVPTPSDKPDSHTSSRKWISGVALRSGDEIVLTGKADGGERAGVDYFILRPVAR
jgi:alpha-glucuronidase